MVLIIDVIYGKKIIGVIVNPTFNDGRFRSTLGKIYGVSKPRSLS